MPTRKSSESVPDRRQREWSEWCLTEKYSSDLNTFKNNKFQHCVSQTKLTFQANVWFGTIEKEREKVGSMSTLGRLWYSWHKIWAKSLHKNDYLLKYQREAQACEGDGHSNHVSGHLTLWPSENVINNMTCFMCNVEMLVTYEGWKDLLLWPDSFCFQCPQRENWVGGRE